MKVKGEGQATGSRPPGQVRHLVIYLDGFNFQAPTANNTGKTISIHSTSTQQGGLSSPRPPPLKLIPHLELTAARGDWDYDSAYVDFVEMLQR